MLWCCTAWAVERAILTFVGADHWCIGVHDQLVVMIITKRLPTTVFSCAAVVLVVQSAIDSLSHFEKAQFASAPEIQKVVSGRESNDIFIHFLWCSLLLQRVGMRHPSPMFRGLCLARIIANGHVPVCGLGCPHGQNHSVGKCFFGDKQASGYVNSVKCLCISGCNTTWGSTWMRMMFRALW